MDDDNTEGPWDGSIQHPFQNIPDAIDIAEPYDHIIILTGLYTGPIEINKPLSLTGQEKDTTILQGDGNAVIISIYSNDVTITQMTITKGYIGMDIANSDSIHIYETTIDNQYIGIEIKGSSNILIDQNTIHDIEVYAIHVTMSTEQESNHLTISNNTIQNNEHGLFLADGQGHHICNNIFMQNQVGIGLFVTTGETTIIEKNELLENTHGIILYSPALYSPITIQNNKIMQNLHAGISCFVDPLSTGKITKTSAIIQYNNIFQNEQQAYMYLTVNGLSDSWNILSGRKTLFHGNYWGTTTSPYPIPAEIAVFIGIVPKLIYQGTLTWGKDTAPATEPYH